MQAIGIASFRALDSHRAQPRHTTHTCTQGKASMHSNERSENSLLKEQSRVQSKLKPATNTRIAVMADLLQWLIQSLGRARPSPAKKHGT
eukprot:5879808-Amphidinium_carterae.1